MPSTDLSKLRVLCVEDDEIARLSIVNIIRRRAAEVYMASNGQEGLDIFMEKRPDLVVADLAMPVMDGSEMIASIREHDLNVPIVIVTAFPDQGKNLEGADYIMVKPVHKNLLLELLHACVRKINEKGKA
ncbi:MAG: response regulator [Geovibrio sp.]|nr:response regulator [Geovibrio sp.]MCD8567173.1 response regulator [Geovibrio sp.]